MMSNKRRPDLIKMVSSQTIYLVELVPRDICEKYL